MSRGILGNADTGAAVAVYRAALPHHGCIQSCGYCLWFIITLVIIYMFIGIDPLHIRP